MKLRRVAKGTPEVMRASLELARSDGADDLLRDQLWLVARGDANALRDALRSFSSQSQGASYDTDRAMRLLQAALTNTSVAPAPEAAADLFRKEAELDGMPAEQAFAQLCSFERGLEELRDALIAERTRGGRRLSPAQAAVKMTEIYEQVNDLVGPEAAHREPLMRSPVARNVAFHHLLAVARIEVPEGSSTPESP